jgi:hypothetical protein
MSFQNKYLKYKQKYLNLKSQSGGAVSPTEVISYIKSKKPQTVDLKLFIRQIYTPGMGLGAATARIQNFNEIRNYVSQNAPEGVTGDMFFNDFIRQANQVKIMSMDQARQIIENYPHVIRAYLFNNTPAGFNGNGNEFVNQHYEDGMTMAEARQIIDRYTLRAYIIGNIPAGVNQRVFITRIFTSGMTLQDAITRIQNYNNIRNYVSQNAPVGVDDDVYFENFANQYYHARMTFQEAEQIIENRPDVIRAYLFNNTPAGFNASEFVEQNYIQNMTMAQARRIIDNHPARVRAYLLDNVPAGFNGNASDFVEQNYIQNMTMTQAIQITDPDEISNTVTQYLFDNAPPGSDPVLFARQYYIDGMSMTQAIQIINNIRSYTNN